MERNAKDVKSNAAPQGATEGPRVSYVPRKDATPEGELSALGAVYRFILECHDRRQKGSRSERVGEGAKKPSSQSVNPAWR